MLIILPKMNFLTGLVRDYISRTTPSQLESPHTARSFTPHVLQLNQTLLENRSPQVLGQGGQKLVTENYGLYYGRLQRNALASPFLTESDKDALANLSDSEERKTYLNWLNQNVDPEAKIHKLLQEARIQKKPTQFLLIGQVQDLSNGLKGILFSEIRNPILKTIFFV